MRFSLKVWACCSNRYRVFKAIFDVVGALCLAVPFLIAATVFLLLNPVFNPGPLFFTQPRMGRGGRRFVAWKFRSMVAATDTARGAFDGLEHDRITRLGHFMRKLRLDELPQILNVLRGEMSLIGPRPDTFAHGKTYLKTVKGYAERLSVLPGISGFAQTEVGYVESLRGMQSKVAADLHYVRKASLSFDLWITWRTVLVVLLRRGQ